MATWSVIFVLGLVVLHAAEARKVPSNGSLNEQKPLKETIVPAADAPKVESPSVGAGLVDKKNFIYGGVGGFAGVGGFTGGIGGMPLIGGLGGIGKYGGIGGYGGLGGLGGGVGGAAGGAAGGGIFHPFP